MGFKNAVRAFHHLDGILCIYKPPFQTMGHIRKVLLMKLCQDLNSLKCRDIRKRVDITGDTSKPLNIEVNPNYADHPLVVGPRYMPEDFRATFAFRLGAKSSGLCVIGINDGCKFIQEYENAAPLKVYHIKGRLGISTDTFFADGKPTFKCNYKYLTSDDINRVVAAVQANHQKNLFHLTGVPLQSQSAYEMAVAGLVRPTSNDAPVIYNIKCIDFNSPDFTLEITCINEDEQYLLKLILDIGYLLKNIASTVSIRCVRVGLFSVQLALLQKHFTLDNVLQNMKQCYNIIEKSKKMDLELQKLEEKPTPSFNDKTDDDVEEVDEDLRDIDPEMKVY